MKSRRLCTIVLTVLLLPSSFLVFTTQAAETYDWSKPRPSNYVPNFNGNTSDATTDGQAAITTGVNVGEYIENSPSHDGNDYLGFKVSVSANTREWIDYDLGYPIHGYQWRGSTRPTNITGDNSGKWLNLHSILLFYGVEYDRIWVSSNGFICLDKEITNPSPQSIPSSSDPNSLISVFWRDLHPENGGSITYEENVEFDGGSYFVVSWNNVPDNSGTPQTFQVLIQIRQGWGSYDVHNKIYFQYQSITKNYDTTIGIEDQLGRRGESISLNEIYNGFSRKVEVGQQGYRLERLKMILKKNDAKAKIDFLQSYIGGYNVLMDNPSYNPYGALFSIPLEIAADCLLGLFIKGAKTAIMLGALVITGQTAIELAAELSPPMYDAKLCAREQENEAYINSTCIFENRSIIYCKPFDSSLAATVEWSFLDPNNMDHSLTVISEAIYRDLSTGNVRTITTSATLNMRVARYVNVATRKATYGEEIIDVKVWVDGSQRYSPTTFSANKGTQHTIQVESSFFRNEWWYYKFDHWEDGSKSNPRTITVGEDDMTITAYYAVTYCCPTLFVWSGTEYVYETLLDIHAGSDVTLQHEIQQSLVLDGLFYKLQLRELDNFTSHIDQVKLYAVDRNDEWHLCPLIIAEHNGTYVTFKMLFDDDNRVDLAPTEIMDLRFLPTIPYHQTTHFIFEINGYNKKME